MVDRFYPLGLASDPDVWKTTYEEMNEMKSKARSPYPPGTSVHLPGQRDRFGFSAVGCDRELLARPDLHPTEEVDVPNPREHQALTRIQIDDDNDTFENHDVGDMLAAKSSTKLATAIFDRSVLGQSMISPGSMNRSRSLPSIRKRPFATPEPVHKLEDPHFTYFVPKSMQGDGADKLNTHHLSKLHKLDRISFPFSGDGTGFKSVSGMTEVFPRGSLKHATTTYNSFFTRPPYHRMTPYKDRGWGGF